MGLLLEAASTLLAMLLLLFWLRVIVGVVLSVRVLRALGAGASGPVGRGVGVSIVIAARDEEHNLARLLPRLLSSSSLLYEVVVADDGSSDGTPVLLEALAGRYGRLKWVRIDHAPGGWAPKSYALYRAVLEARGDVILFLDADVEVGDVEALLSTAASTGPGEIIAFVPRFLCRGLVCKSCEAVVTAVAYGFYGLHRVVDDRDPLAWMYGCCWSIRRSDYWSLGGHGSEGVRGSPVEDRAFASHAKRKGYRIRIVDARGTVGVWTYESIRGHASLAARLALEPLEGKKTLAKYAYLAAVSLALYLPLVVAVSSPSPLHAAPLALQAAAYAVGAVIEGYSPAYAIPAFYAQALLPLGLIQAIAGRVSWKGRPVGISGSPPGSPEQQNAPRRGG